MTNLTCSSEANKKYIQNVGVKTFHKVGICKRVKEMWTVLKRIFEKYGMNL
jgi:hypothetical protein